MGNEIASVNTSAAVCVISTPKSPKIFGRSRISGIKQMPFLADEVMDAFTPFPIDCSIILLMITIAESGKAQHCACSATFPTATTSGSSRNTVITSGAKIKQPTASTLRNTVPHLTQNQKPSFTLR